MFKSKYNNNLKKKVKINLFRFSYFYSLLKLRNKFYITLKDKFNKFKLIKELKKKNKINNLILKTLSYKYINKVKYNLDYFLNLKNNQNYTLLNNTINFYKNKKEKYIPFFNNIYFKSKVFYNVFLDIDINKDKQTQHSKYYKNFWFFKFLLNLKILNFYFLKAKINYYELININYFEKFLKFLKLNVLVKFLQCIKSYYNVNTNNSNIINAKINLLLIHLNIINNNYILTSDINFNKKNKKETYYWTRALMKKKKWKTNNIYPYCLDMFKDVVEQQFKNNLILNLIKYNKIKNIHLKYNIKQYVAENNNKKEIDSTFKKSSLQYFWFFFSKFLKKWYFFKDLLILKLNKYNLYLMRKYYFFIKIIKSCLLKLLNCFKYCWKVFNKKKINIINVLRFFIFFVFYKKLIKIKKLLKKKKLSFFFKRKKKKSLKRHLKKNSLISKLILKLKLLKKLKLKNKKLLKIKIKKRFYYRYKTLIPRFKMTKKQKEAWKLKKLERLKEKNKLKKLKYLKIKKLKLLKLKNVK